MENKEKKSQKKPVSKLDIVAIVKIGACCLTFITMWIFPYIAMMSMCNG